MAAPASRLTKKPILGLVGGVGCGKSTVAGLLRELGGGVVAGDPAGHEALRQPELRGQVVARWGQGLLNETGEIDRPKLGRIVFAQPEERRHLEQIVFPWIRQRLREELERVDAETPSRFIVLDAAVMLEAGWDAVCDRILFIDVPEAVRWQRVARQRDWSAEEVRGREAAQWSLEQKRALADAVVDNGGSEAQTRAQLEQVLQRFDQEGWIKERPSG